MVSGFGDLVAGMRLSGVVVDGDVTIVAVERHGSGSVTLTYRTADGQLGERIVFTDDLNGLTEVSERRWSFDADGAMFRLASEARRMQQAYLVDPFAAVDTSSIEPYPHQIDAVYNRLLTRKPLRFLLADDPGAGKTVMSGLLIRELMLRGDVMRCLIVAPGSLVEQWQEELWDKFGLSFELMSRATVEASLTGNPFTEKNLLVARLDQLARSDELRAKLKASDWDLVIVDEAHKMSAHRYRDELHRTKRFILGETLRDRTRHFLLLTATPHNGKNEDFLAFMTLIDPERFEGRLRTGGTRSGGGVGGGRDSRGIGNTSGDGTGSAGVGGNSTMPDVSDVMRRLVKENLRTFEGTRLFPRRYAHSLNFELSEPEAELYEAVTAYVRNGMNRADRIASDGDRRQGTIIGFALAGLQRRLASSPAAIHRSLCRRRDRLTEQAAELRRLAASGRPVAVVDLPKGVRLGDFEDFDFDDYDFDDYDDAEREKLEHCVIDAATTAQSAEEREIEVQELEELVKLADGVRSSGVDTKWVKLRGLLRSQYFASTTPHEPADTTSTPSHEPADTTSDCAGHPQATRKLIVFSEHRDTLEYVADRIASELGRAEAVVRIHGGISRHERRFIQDRFRTDPTVRVLVATDAAGEGVNLQVANMMVNYDLPWNPNRIEQRFGRIHRIGQRRPCHLWNLIAHRTREGQVFKRLFAKIKQQQTVYGDQVYDVLGDSLINTSLRDLLVKAIVADADPGHAVWMDEIMETDIGDQMRDVLEQRALVDGLTDPAVNDKIRRDMEIAQARKLQPWFVESFFTEVLKMYGGRIVGREQGRFEVTRIPASVRSHADSVLGPVHDRYERVTFNKASVQPAIPPGGDPDAPAAVRAELIAPGTPLLDVATAKVLADHGDTLRRGAILVDQSDRSTDPRLLVYLDHTITHGLQESGNRRVVSRRFQYVEIDRHGNARDPGNEPYLDYAPLSEDQQHLLEGNLDLDWVDHAAEDTARAWGIDNLAGPHFDEVNSITSARVEKVRTAVRKRLESEIRYWDLRTEELKTKEIAGQKPRISSGRARARAEDLTARLARRRLELDREADLHSSPPTLVTAALIIPQGLLDRLADVQPDLTEVVDVDRTETDRRAVAAVMKAELALGRMPEEQHHSNPGYDILSTDPTTGVCYFIEVKGHLPRTEQISVSRRQVGQSKCNSKRWRLAVVSVPDDPHIEPEVHYLVDPFQDMDMHQAQTSVPLNVAELLALPYSGPPR